MVNFKQQVVEGCVQGDEQSQFALYRLYYKSVYSSCLRILKQADEAEDAMQEAFIKAFASIKKLPDSNLVEQWIKRIAINISIDMLRKKKIQLVELTPKVEVEDDEKDDYSQIQLQVAAIKEGINHLSDGCRLVLTLNLIEGYDYEEIASILGISESSVRSQYTRGKKKLLELLTAAKA